jgi:hypothetical protein
MTVRQDNRAMLVAVFVMVAFNGLFLSLNGLFMLVAPQVWYDFVPGVTDTGFFNQHFIRDIGLIQLFLGLAFGVGMFRPERRIGLWAVATLWLWAHALFPPVGSRRRQLCPSVIIRDFPAVSLPAIVGTILNLWAIRQAHAGRTALA